MLVPTDNQIKTLHHKYATNDKVFELVFTHCRIVREIAEQIINNKNLIVNKDLVKAGALLHDIGAYQWINGNSQKDYIKHGIIGSAILKQEGFDESLRHIVERHIGVGLTKEDIINEKLPLPPKDYMPQTVEEKLVCYSDKFHSKTPRFNSYEYYKESARKFSEDKVMRFEKLAEEFGIPDIENLAKKYDMPIW